MAAEAKLGPVLSPVDYDAWNRGYLPPGEHVLIDALSYRGAHVIASSTGDDFGFWLVIKGEIIDRKKLSAITLQLHQTLGDLIEDMREAKQAEIPPTNEERSNG